MGFAAVPTHRVAVSKARQEEFVQRQAREAGTAAPRSIDLSIWVRQHRIRNATWGTSSQRLQFQSAEG